MSFMICICTFFFVYGKLRTGFSVCFVLNLERSLQLMTTIGLLCAIREETLKFVHTHTTTVHAR